MTVTISYSFNFVKNLDLALGPATQYPAATSLAGGGFAVSGEASTTISLEVFSPFAGNMDGTASIGDSLSPTSIDQLASGKIIVLTNPRQVGSFSELDIALADTAGAILRKTSVPHSASSTNYDVAALSGGDFWVVRGQPPDDNVAADIIVDFGNNDGNFVGSFNATSAISSNCFRPSAVGLDNGTAALAWVDDGNNVFVSVYDSLGSVIAAPVNVGKTDVLSKVAMSATAKGFALAYADNSWGTIGSDITLKQFASDGSLLMTSNVSNPNLALIKNKESEPALARMSNEFLAVAYKVTIPPAMKTDPTVIDTLAIVIDPTTGTPQAARNVAGGEAFTDVVETPTAAGFANGGVAVFHRNVTDNDIDGEHLQATRISTGDAARNTLNGDSLIDIMTGGGGKDTLRGLGGRDNLNGGAEDDSIEGGRGCDAMTGGRGADHFAYQSTGDSPAGATCDIITDFVHRTDKIDLSNIDAQINTLGNNAFKFRGTLGFTSEGQVRVVQSGLNTIVEVNTKGATGAEMTIQLDKVTASSLSLIDFFF